MTDALKADYAITPQVLRAELQKRGRSQAALARHLNLDNSAVNRMVNGTRQIKAKELGPIVDYLKSTGDANSIPFLVDTSKLTPLSRSAIAQGNVSKSGNAYTSFAHAYFMLFSNLRRGLSDKLPEDRGYDEEFWKVIEPRPEVWPLLAVGAGLITPLQGELLEAFFRFGEAVTAMGVDGELSEGIRSLAYVVIGEERPDDSQEELISRLSVKVTALGFLLQGDDKETIDELRALLAELEARRLGQ